MYLISKGCFLLCIIDSAVDTIQKTKMLLNDKMGKMAAMLCTPDTAVVIVHSAVFLKQCGYWHWLSVDHFVVQQVVFMRMPMPACVYNLTLL